MAYRPPERQNNFEPLSPYPRPTECWGFQGPVVSAAPPCEDIPHGGAVAFPDSSNARYPHTTVGQKAPLPQAGLSLLMPRMEIWRCCFHHNTVADLGTRRSRVPPKTAQWSCREPPSESGSERVERMGHENTNAQNHENAEYICKHEKSHPKVGLGDRRGRTVKANPYPREVLGRTGDFSSHRPICAPSSVGRNFSERQSLPL
jgi:hypothetical protein